MCPSREVVVRVILGLSPNGLEVNRAWHWHGRVVSTWFGGWLTERYGYGQTS